MLCVWGYGTFGGLEFCEALVGGLFIYNGVYIKVGITKM